jgi:hypothetical protein
MIGDPRRNWRLDRVAGGYKIYCVPNIWTLVGLYNNFVISTLAGFIRDLHLNPMINQSVGSLNIAGEYERPNSTVGRLLDRLKIACRWVCSR